MNKKHTQARKLRRLSARAAAAALGLAGLMAGAPSAWAESDGFQTVLTLPQGVACTFPLVVEARGTANFFKEFYDKNQQLVRVMRAGSGVDFRFTNGWTQKQYLLLGRGGMSKDTIAEDGTVNGSMQGHSVILFYPTDVPAGPKSIEYIGKVSYTIGTDGVFELKGASGQQSDLCAKLASSPD